MFPRTMQYAPQQYPVGTVQGYYPVQTTTTSGSDLSSMMDSMMPMLMMIMMLAMIMPMMRGMTATTTK